MSRHRASSMSPRSVFYLLTNIDEHPEALLFARSIVTDHIDDTNQRIAHTAESRPLGQDGDSLTELIHFLDTNRAMHVLAWHNLEGQVDASIAKHLLTQYAPTALLHGCWLKRVLRSAMAATPAGARLASILSHHLHALHSKNNFPCEYRELHRQIAFTLPDVASRSFSDLPAFKEYCFSLPIFLLCIGQFPQIYLPEILGLHLGWHCLGLNAFGPSLIRETRLAHSLPNNDTYISYLDQTTTGRQLAMDAAEQSLAEQSGGYKAIFLSRMRNGALIVNTIWNEWMSFAANSNASHATAIKQRMIEILHEKRPHALGYHREKLVDGVRIDSLLSADNFKPVDILDKLGRSEFVVPGKPEESPICTSLVAWGGPMYSVFSPTELATIRAWILTLSRRSEPSCEHASVSDSGTYAPRLRHGNERLLCSKTDLLRRSRASYGNCSLRELYHCLVNIEHYPEIFPRAEEFVRNRLARSMAALNSRIRPIPSRHYCPETLDSWVNKKHREQVNEYEPLKGKPTITKEAFIYHSVQLAPLILIDGSWLQGILTHNSIYTETDRILFQILFEEAGEGDSRRHHANIYLELLNAMGIQLPAIESRDFIEGPTFLDSSFEIPVFWLSISCFSRHFMPEILGLNLAVELAGVGGPYMQARDTLQYFNFPTRFVDVHLAADNVSQGHTAKSVLAIKYYMDQISAREGPHNLDATWRRIWSGVRSTLPQVGLPRLVAHRAIARLRGTNIDEVPRIFVD